LDLVIAMLPDHGLFAGESGRHPRLEPSSKVPEGRKREAMGRSKAAFSTSNLA